MRRTVYLSLLLVLLSGCAPINTKFSCNATASDHCLSIEEVYALSETHPDLLLSHQELAKTPCMKCVNHNPKYKDKP